MSTTIQPRGVHFIGRFPTVYFHVPPDLGAFRVTISSGSTEEPAAADLIDPERSAPWPLLDTRGRLTAQALANSGSQGGYWRDCNGSGLGFPTCTTFGFSSTNGCRHGSSSLRRRRLKLELRTSMPGFSLTAVSDRTRGWARGADDLGTGMRIFRAATIVAGATLIVKFGGLAKELTVAGYFGRSDDLEAFMMALLLPSFMLSIIAGGSNSSIIPVLVDLRVNHGRSEAQRLMSSVACLGGGLLLTVALLLALAAPLILPGLCPGFSQEKLKMTERIFYWLLPALFIRGFSAMWADILNAGHKFALASLTPLATSLSIALALLALGRSYGANTLVGAFLVGSFVEATLLSSALRREAMEPGFRNGTAWTATSEGGYQAIFAWRSQRDPDGELGYHRQRHGGCIAGRQCRGVGLRQQDYIFRVGHRRVLVDDGGAAPPVDDGG